MIVWREGNIYVTRGFTVALISSELSISLSLHRLSAHVHLNTQFLFFFYPPSLAQDETKTSDLSSSYTLTHTESRAGYL